MTFLALHACNLKSFFTVALCVCDIKYMILCTSPPIFCLRNQRRERNHWKVVNTCTINHNHFLWRITIEIIWFTPSQFGDIEIYSNARIYE